MKVEQIKTTAIINMEFSTSFFKRLQNLTTAYIEKTSLEALEASYKAIREGEELSEWQTNLETLLILVNSMENAAREQGLVEVNEVPEAV